MKEVLTENLSNSLNLGKSLRSDFPFFTENAGTAFLDSAASSLTPTSVIEAITKYYKKYSVNIHRGVYHTSVAATNHYENIRAEVKRFLKCSLNQEVIFTSGATASLNLLAHSLGSTGGVLSDFFSGWKGGLEPGDIILLSESEHHSNIIPWQLLSKRMKLELKFIPIHKNGTLNEGWFKKFISSRPPLKILSLAHVSNVTGVVHNLDLFIEAANSMGIPFIIDGAQSVCHMEQDLSKIKNNFLVFSAHKMLGPTGIGVLVGNQEVLNVMEPFLGGGDMILSVSKEGSTYSKSPHRFEAGTPGIAQVFGLGAAIEYLNSIGMQKIEEWGKKITHYAMTKMKETDLRVYGPSLNDLEKGISKVGVLSFDYPGIHPHDIGTVLDEVGVAIRTGHHCCQILMKSWDVSATARASIYLYNDFEDIDQLIEGMQTVRKIFQS